MNLKMCLNPKAITLLAMIGVAVLIVAPSVALSIISLLILAVCPLSMLIMGSVMMRSHHGSDESGKASDDEGARGER